MNKLSFKVPIAYPVKCVIRRGRTERTIHVKAEIDVEIPSVSRSDLVEAVRVRAATGGQPQRVFSRLSHEGHLYAQHEGLGNRRGRGWVLHADVDQLRQIATVEETRRLLDGPNHFGKSPWGYPTDGILDALPLNVDRVVSSGFEEIQAKVRDMCSEMLLVDGLLHDRRGPPHLHVYYPDGGGYGSLTIDNHWSQASTMFSVLRYETGCEFGAALAKRFRGEVMFSSSLTSYAVEAYEEDLVPSVFEKERNAEAAANRFLYLVGSCLTALPPEGFDAMARLSRGLVLVRENDVDAPEAIERELDLFATSGLLDKVKDAKRAEIERELEIGIAGIRISPKSPEPVIPQNDDGLGALTF